MPQPLVKSWGFATALTVGLPMALPQVRSHGDTNAISSTSHLLDNGFLNGLLFSLFQVKVEVYWLVGWLVG